MDTLAGKLLLFIIHGFQLDFCKINRDSRGNERIKRIERSLVAHRARRKLHCELNGILITRDFNSANYRK